MKTRTFVHEDQLTPNGSKTFFATIRLIISCLAGSNLPDVSILPKICDGSMLDILTFL